MRKIPMDDRVYAAFLHQREIWNNNKKIKDFHVGPYTNFVFLSKRSGVILDENLLRSQLRRLVNRYNQTREIKLPAISPHILRHTACTRFCEAGLDIKVVQYLMGHSDIRTTMRIYNHTNPERVMVGIQQLNAAVQKRKEIFLACEADSSDGLVDTNFTPEL